MKKRFYLKKGDIFKVNLGNKTKFFQYVMIDSAQLNSEVIRAFSYTLLSEEKPDLNEIISSKIDFYAHVVIKWGIQMELYEKIGNVPIEENIDLPYFRVVPLYNKFIVNGEIKYCETDEWVAWQAGDLMDNRKPIGNLNQITKKYFLGLIKSPLEIVERIKTGKYSRPYFT